MLVPAFVERTRLFSDNLLNCIPCTLHSLFLSLELPCRRMHQLLGIAECYLQVVFFKQLDHQVTMLRHSHRCVCRLINLKGN